MLLLDSSNQKREWYALLAAFPTTSHHVKYFSAIERPYPELVGCLEAYDSHAVWMGFVLLAILESGKQSLLLKIST